MTKITIHQPAYLPWLGYFDKIKKSDVFIFLDSVQFEKNSFINRNKIKTANGPIWLTVPVFSKNHFQTSLKYTEINNKANWRRDHFLSIYYNYRKAKRFDECYEKLKLLYEKEYTFLSDLCWSQLLFWLNELKIDTKVIRASDLNIQSKKSDLILDLCKYFEADCYLSGSLGKDYLVEGDFHKEGIKIEYQNYQHPIYEQLWRVFLPNLSIVDLWMNSDQFDLIWGEGEH
jgi:hypothetical protein